MRVIVFSGTTEGRIISEYLNQNKIYTMVFVATEFGKDVMKNMPFVSVNIGRLNSYKMANFISDFKCDFVIDATHPYAILVSENIKKACDFTGVEYYRIKREETNINIDDYNNNIIFFKNIYSAVQYLKNTDGNIFVSTGSNEIHLFSEINNYKNRIFARVLPSYEAQKKCQEIGLINVIYKKGPFSFDENIEDFKNSNAKYIVTKNSGQTGGFNEKIEAANALKIKSIVIKRIDELGISIKDIKNIILEKRKIENE